MVVAGFTQETSELHLGNNYYKDGSFGLAETHYRNALPDEKARFNLANALVRQQKYRDALTVLGELTKEATDPKIKAAAYYNTGVVLSREKDLPASIEAYKAALRLTPGDEHARENLQKALLEWKKQQEESKKQQKKPSNMEQKQANRHLEQLQEKEERVRARLQQSQKRTSLPKDW